MLETRRLFCVLCALALCLAVPGGRAESPRPALELQRDVTRRYVRAGGSTTIVYRVENTGNVALQGVRVTDPMCGAVCEGADLAPDEYRVYTVTIAVTGPCQSAPTASWLYEGMTYEKTLEPAAIVLAEDSLGVTLRADTYEVPAGGAVFFTALLENSGNTPLSDIALEDENLGSIGTVRETIAPGASLEYAFSAQLSGNASICLRATAQSASGESFSALSNSLSLVLTPDEGTSRLTLRAAADGGACAPGLTPVTLTLFNSGSGDIGRVIVSELRLGTLRELAALAPGETSFVCMCPLAASGDMQFLAEYADAPGSTAIVFSAPLHVEARPGGAEPSSAADPLEALSGPRLLSEGRSAYAALIYAMLALYAALAAVLVWRLARRRRQKRRMRLRRIRRMRTLRRNARMDEAEWVRTRPHKPVSPQDKE